MKRWIGILILALLLTGCGSREPASATDPTQSGNLGTDPSVEQSAATVEQTPEPTAPESTVDDSVALNSMIPAENATAVAEMGANMLLFGRDRLSVYAFGSAEPAISVEISDLPGPDSGLLRVVGNTVVYFDEKEGAAICLDEMLQQSWRRELGETVQGSPWLSGDGTKLYFCTAGGIRVWDLDTGVCRNLKLQEGSWLGITGTLLDGTALRCRLLQEDGSVRTLLVSSETGQTLWEGEELNSITGSGELYCYDAGEEWIFGLVGQQPQLLYAEDLTALPEIGAAVSVTASEEGLCLELYDLASGLRTAAVELTGIGQISGLTAFGDYLWFFADSALYRWDPALSPTEDDTVYTAYRYTATSPDTEGLEGFRIRAQDLEERYGVEILMWNDAAAAEPAGYTFEIEWRTECYESGFAALESALACFPDTMPDRAADWTEDGILRIVLVHSITSPSEEEAYAALSGMEYLLDGKVYIVLAMDGDVEQSFLHALYHVIDPLALSNSIAYYKWSSLNPSGFRYDNDYIANLDRDSSQYLEGEKRYFIDTYSMSYAVEDRARIFEYAILPGNEEYFSSKYMQAKLSTLCAGLREVFGLDGESYIWEQYLQ